MRTDWLPVSAALLLTGALALGLGGFLLPQSDNASDSLRIVQDQGGQWMAAAVVLFIASVCLTLGLPAVLTLFDQRGRTLGMISCVVLEVGWIGTAGFAMLMIFFRALVRTDAIVGRSLDDVAHEAGLAIFLYLWIAAVYLGELLLGLALLRARTVPRWIPLLLVLHALTFLVSGVLPGLLAKATVLLLVLGFSGIAVQAASPDHRRHLA